jgi:hypothetical protein
LSALLGQLATPPPVIAARRWPPFEPGPGQWASSADTRERAATTVAVAAWRAARDHIPPERDPEDVSGRNWAERAAWTELVEHLIRRDPPPTGGVRRVAATLRARAGGDRQWGELAGRLDPAGNRRPAPVGRSAVLDRAWELLGEGRPSPGDLDDVLDVDDDPVGALRELVAGAYEGSRARGLKRTMELRQAMVSAVLASSHLTDDVIAALPAADTLARGTPRVAAYLRARLGTAAPGWGRLLDADPPRSGPEAWRPLDDYLSDLGAGPSPQHA